MRKGFMKRCLAFGLTLAMTAGLCGCGGGSAESDPNLAKENVYRLQEIELPELYDPENGDMGFLSAAHKDGKIYMIVRINDWSGENYKENDIRVISMNEDGSDVQVVALDIPQTGQNEMMNAPIALTEPENTPAEGEDAPAEDGETPEAGAEGEDAPAEDGETPEAGAEGEDAPAEDGETPEAGTEDEDAPAEDGETPEAGTEDGDFSVDVPVVDDEYVANNVWENIYYDNFTLMSDGNVFGVKTHNFEDGSDPENYVNWNKLSVCCWDPQGKLLWENELSDMDDNTWVNAVLEGSDGAVYLILAVNSEELPETAFYKVQVGSDGSMGDKKELSEESRPLFNSREQIIRREDGSYFAIYRDEDDWQKVFYTTYDVAADTVGEAKEFPSSIISSYNYNSMRSGISHDLIYTGNGGIFCWDQGEEAGKLMVDYINSDLYIEGIYGIVELDESSFIGIYRADYSGGVKAGIFTYVKPEDIQDKKVLVLAGNYVPDDVKQRVIEYNRNNADYRIVLKEYSIYNDYYSEDGYNRGITQLNNDIISGGMPDILVTSNGDLPMDNYISSGLIADVDKLIREDEELSKVEFMQNAFDAYRTDGKLHYIVPDFEVYTMIAKKSLVGDRESWTMQDMQQVLDGMEGAKAFAGDVNQNMFIEMVMRYCGNQFVDVSTGKCSFNTEDFISMMEYAKSLPSANQEQGGYDEEYWDTYWQTYESQYRENRTLLMEANFWKFDSVSRPINGMIGEDVAYVGFPTEAGNGSYIMSSRLYALSAKSKNLDEAWNFMRYYLTDEYQDDLDSLNYFAVKKDSFYEQSKKAMEKRYWEYTDENGETVREYEDMSVWINGEAVPYEPLSQEQVDELIAFIESVHNPYYYNEQIMKIINEEIDGYFTGDKPAKDVADVIQRRVQIYVDENG